MGRTPIWNLPERDRYVALACALVGCRYKELIRTEGERDAIVVIMKDVIEKYREGHPDVKVLKMKWGLAGGEPMTFQEVAETYGLTREAIKKIVYKTMRRLRHPAYCQSYLELLQ